MHQYNKDELVIKKGTRIRRLHMMLGGEVQQIQKEGSKRFLQGHSLCE